MKKVALVVGIVACLLVVMFASFVPFEVWDEFFTWKALSTAIKEELLGITVPPWANPEEEA